VARAQLVVQNIGGVVAVDISYASLLDEETIQSIQEPLLELIDQQAQRKIVLDFSKVRLLSSRMLGVLITVRKHAAAIDGEVVLAGLRPDLHKVFKISRLDKLFRFYDTTDDAMKGFGVSLA